MAYAETTSVPFERSIADIITILRKSGADRMAQMEERSGYIVQFFSHDRMIRFRVKFPSIDEMPKFNGRNQALTNAQRIEKLEQAKRQRGRALMLVIKAKLESVESQVETFEEAFLANVVMADGKTMYERVQEPIALEYQSGVPKLMLTSGGE